MISETMDFLIFFLKQLNLTLKWEFSPYVEFNWCHFGKAVTWLQCKLSFKIQFCWPITHLPYNEEAGDMYYYSCKMNVPHKNCMKLGYTTMLKIQLVPFVFCSDLIEVSFEHHFESTRWEVKPALQTHSCKKSSIFEDFHMMLALPRDRGTATAFKTA